MEIAKRAVAEGGESGELGTGTDGGVYEPTRPFFASSSSDRTCDHQVRVSKGWPCHPDVTLQQTHIAGQEAVH